MDAIQQQKIAIQTIREELNWSHSIGIPTEVGGTAL